MDDKAGNMPISIGWKKQGDFNCAFNEDRVIFNGSLQYTSLEGSIKIQSDKGKNILIKLSPGNVHYGGLINGLKERDLPHDISLENWISSKPTKPDASYLSKFLYVSASLLSLPKNVLEEIFVYTGIDAEDDGLPVGWVKYIDCGFSPDGALVYASSETLINIRNDKSRSIKLQIKDTKLHEMLIAGLKERGLPYDLLLGGAIRSKQTKSEDLYLSKFLCTLAKILSLPKNMIEEISNHIGIIAEDDGLPVGWIKSCNLIGLIGIKGVLCYDSSDASITVRGHEGVTITVKANETTIYEALVGALKERGLPRDNHVTSPGGLIYSKPIKCGEDYLSKFLYIVSQILSLPKNVIEEISNHIGIIAEDDGLHVGWIKSGNFTNVFGQNSVEYASSDALIKVRGSKKENECVIAIYIKNNELYDSLMLSLQEKELPIPSSKRYIQGGGVVSIGDALLDDEYISKFLYATFKVMSVPEDIAKEVYRDICVLPYLDSIESHDIFTIEPTSDGSDTHPALKVTGYIEDDNNGAL